MTTMASTLLDFILGLFRDEDAAAAFAEDPHAALTAAGLGDVDPGDVHALMPMVADSSPGAYGGHGRHDKHDKDDDDDKDHGKHDRDHDKHDRDDHHRPVKDDDCDDDDGHWHKVWHEDDDCDDDKHDDRKHDRDDDKKDHDGRPNHDYAGHGHDAAVIHNVKYVENNYSHTDVDVEIENAIWAGGDVQAIFGDDNVVATGGSVAAGDDVEGVLIDNSETDIDVDVEIEDSFNQDNDTTTITNSGNKDTNIADRGGENNVLEVEDVTVVNDSFNGATIAGGDVDQSTEVEIEDSLNGNQLAGGDVNNTEVEIEDSLNGNQLAGDDINDTEVEESVIVNDSLNGNNVAGDDVNEIEDSLVVNDSFSDNELEIETGAPDYAHQDAVTG
jgi:hypothetical protein